MIGTCIFICDSQNKDKFVSSMVLVRRVERLLKKQLQSATPQKRIILYATKDLV